MGLPSNIQADLCRRGRGRNWVYGPRGSLRLVIWEAKEALGLKWRSFLTGAMFEHLNMARNHQGGQKQVLWMEEWQQGFAPDNAFGDKHLSLEGQGRRPRDSWTGS